MFWLKSITAVVVRSNESGRVSRLCIPLISRHWWRMWNSIMTALVYLCVCVNAAPVLPADPG